MTDIEIKEGDDGHYGIWDGMGEIDIDKLIAGITPETRHAWIDIGPPIGREIIDGGWPSE
jgi:hypothetical protein